MEGVEGHEDRHPGANLTSDLFDGLSIGRTATDESHPALEEVMVSRSAANCIFVDVNGDDLAVRIDQFEEAGVVQSTAAVKSSCFDDVVGFDAEDEVAHQPVIGRNLPHRDAKKLYASLRPKKKRHLVDQFKFLR